jgi:hypothetical protein
LLSYSLLQLGYFIEDMVMHTFVRERTSDFWEMHLHHFLTITLIGGMIMQNFIRAGTIGVNKFKKAIDVNRAQP